MARKYDKPFGTFELRIGVSYDAVKIFCKINGEDEFVAKELDDKNKAIKFWIEQKVKIDGKTIPLAGALLPDFEDVKREYEEMRNKLISEKKSKKDAEVNAIKSGEKKIQVTYRDGEYMDGYVTGRIEEELLEELGLAKYVDGWGTVVDFKLIQALGKEFTYQQVLEYLKPIREQRERVKAEKEAKRKAKFDEAKRTSKPVILYQYTVDCNDKNEDCSFDTIIVYAMPDGSQQEKRFHNW